MLKLWIRRITYCSAIMICVVLLSILVKKDIQGVTLQKENVEGYTLIINEVMPKNLVAVEDCDGEYSDWIELYNYGDQEIPLQGVGLTDNLDDPYRWVFPDITIEADSYLIVYCSGKDRVDAKQELHTNFCINAKGESLALTSPSEQVIDQVYIPEEIRENSSYGRKYNNMNEFAIFSTYTLGRANQSSVQKEVASIGKIGEVEFSVQGGNYKEAVDVALTSSVEEGRIYYTLDGSEPNLSSQIYEKPIHIQEGVTPHLYSIDTSIYSHIIRKVNDKEVYTGTVVRARVWKDGTLSDTVQTNTYFIDKEYSLPVISISTKPDDMFGYRNGIYILGAAYDLWKKYNPSVKADQTSPANYNMDKTIEAHIEMWETDGKKVVDQDIGLSVFGNYSRFQRAKSLKVTASKKYDSSSEVTYDLFQGSNVNYVTGDPIVSYKTFLIRNSGNDFYGQNTDIYKGLMMKDGYMQTIAREMGLTTQAYRPAILFVDGEYWGIQNIREKIDEYYFQSNYGVDKNQVSIIKSNKEEGLMELDYGSQDDVADYNELLHFIEEKDMSEDSNLALVNEKIDLENLIDYYVTQIYFGNWDWPDNNFKLWRSSTINAANPYEDHRWRFVFYDLDHGSEDYRFNSLKVQLQIPLQEEEKNLSETDYKRWNVSLFKNLMENEQFKQRFIDRFYVCIDRYFSAEHVLPIVDHLVEQIAGEIKEHEDRWLLGDTWIAKLIGYKDKTYTWDEKIEFLREYIVMRPEYMKKYLQELQDGTIYKAQ